MIILDTNVLSELMRHGAASPIADWIARAGLQDEFRMTSISRAEILSGIAILAPGRRSRELETAATRVFATGFDGPVLSFDAPAADHYAQIMAVRRQSGRSTAPLDMMMAAIARSQGASVATRNVSDFEDCGLILHDPWRLV